MRLRAHFNATILLLPSTLTGLTGCQALQVQTLNQKETRGDFVQTYLQHAEACRRCAASHPDRGHGEQCGPPYEMGRFVDHLVHENNGPLLEILHSTRIPNKGKMAILQYLNETIEKEYPGTCPPE